MGNLIGNFAALAALVFATVAVCAFGYWVYSTIETKIKKKKFDKTMEEIGNAVDDMIEDYFKNSTISTTEGLLVINKPDTNFAPPPSTDYLLRLEYGDLVEFKGFGKEYGKLAYVLKVYPDLKRLRVMAFKNNMPMELSISMYNVVKAHIANQ